MRTAPSAVLLSVLVPLAVVAAPVVSAPHAAPHPVAPEFRSQPLGGAAQRAAVGAGGVRGSARPSFRAAPGSADSRPVLRVTRTGVAAFDLLGVTWSAGQRADLTVRVRTHRSAGWTGWTTLDPADAPAPQEGSTARPGTEPLWVGASDGYQVRVAVRSGVLPRGLRVDLVDPGSSRADADVGAGRPLQSAQAATAMPTILTRAQWGADESLRTSAPRYTGAVQAGFVHHTAGTNGYSAADVPKIIRGIYAYHVKANGWSDIGYNYLVDRFGRLWEGRYGGITRNVLGAHTGGFNVNSFAVSAIGDYEKATPSSVMIDSIARLLAWRLSLAYRNPTGTTVLTSQGGVFTRYAAGARVTFDVISGHRDAGQTECPGKNLYAQLPRIRTLAAGYLGTALLDPHPEPASAVYGRGASITTVSGVTSDQQWTLRVSRVCDGTLVRTLSGTASPGVPVRAAWDLRDDAGAAVRPGAYTVTLSSADAGAAARTWSGQVTVQAAASAPAPPAAAPLPGRATFVPVDPVTLYDTRAAGSLPLGPGGRVDLTVPGTGTLPPDGIAAVALSISAGCATSDTAVTAWAAGSPMPASPALNVRAGTAGSALAVTPLGGNGAVSVANSAGTTELAVHVVGYYPVSGGQVFRPSGPVRIYDSRRDPKGVLEPGVDRLVTLPTRSRVPAASMTGALLNVTTLSAAGTGTLTVQSAAGDRSNATLSFTRGRVVKNRVVARLQDGALKLTSHAAATQVVVELVGWWAPPEVMGGRLFQPRPTARVLDTRSGLGARRGRLRAGGVVSVKVAGKGRPAPYGARVVVMNVTARNATRATFVTAWPKGTRRPAYPDLAVPAWRPTANLVVVRVGRGGRVLLTNGSGLTHLVADVVGYYR